MLRRFLGQVLIWAAPSVPRGLRGRVAHQSPVPGARGEARPGTGSTSGADPRSAGDRGRGAIPVAPRPSHPELLLNWRPAPENRGDLSDFGLAFAIEAWSDIR